MKTVTVLIGNSDNKLTQAAWSGFIADLTDIVFERMDVTHFRGHSNPESIYQNHAIVFTIDDSKIEVLKNSLRELKDIFKQDSIALVLGDSEFV